MPSPRDIRRRIKSVRSTAQITRAMQTVAASKMRKAQHASVQHIPHITRRSHAVVTILGGQSRLVAGPNESGLRPSSFIKSLLEPGPTHRNPQLQPPNPKTYAQIANRNSKPPNTPQTP